MLRFFNTTNPVVLFVLVIIIPVLTFFSWGIAPENVQDQNMAFYSVVLLVLQPLPWASPIVFALIVAVCAVRVSVLSNKLELFDQRNYLPTLVFSLFVCAGISQQMLSPVVCGLPFVIWALQRSWGERSEEGATSRQFDAGMLIGVAAMFHLPYLLLLPAFLVGMAFMRTYRWREWLFMIVGVGIVFLFVGASYYLMDLEMPMNGSGSIWQIQNAIMSATVITWIFLAVSSILVLWSFVWFFAAYQHSKMRRKNILKAFGVVAIFLVAITFFTAASNQMAFPAILLALPISVLFSFLFRGLQDKRPNLANVMFYLWLGLLLFSLWSERSQLLAA